MFHAGEKLTRKTLKELEGAGLIEVTRRGQGRTNAYKINDPDGQKGSVLTLPLGGSRTADPPDPSMPEDVEQDKPSEGGSDPPQSTARKRDALFDALAVACDLRLDQITREQGRVCGVATAELRRLGVEPGDIAPAVRRYRIRYPGAAATPKAIANHWAEIVPPAQRQPACSECGVGSGAHTADCPTLARAG